MKKPLTNLFRSELKSPDLCLRISTLLAGIAAFCFLFARLLTVVLVLVLLPTPNSQLPTRLWAATADMKATLNSADGSTSFQVQDSGANRVGEIDSDGNMLLIGSATVRGAGLMTSALTSTGAATIQGAGTIQGAADLQSNTNVGGWLNVVGSATIQGAAGLKINGNSIQDSAGATRIGIGATNNLTGNVAGSGWLNVVGSATIQGSGGLSGSAGGGAGANSLRISSGVYFGPTQTSRWITDEPTRAAISISTNLYVQGTLRADNGPFVLFPVGRSYTGTWATIGTVNTLACNGYEGQVMIDPGIFNGARTASLRLVVLGGRTSATGTASYEICEDGATSSLWTINDSLGTTSNETQDSGWFTWTPAGSGFIRINYYIRKDAAGTTGEYGSAYILLRSLP